MRRSKLAVLNNSVAGAGYAFLIISDLGLEYLNVVVNSG